MARDRLAIASRIITTPPLIQFLTVTLTLPLRRAIAVSQPNSENLLYLLLSKNLGASMPIYFHISPLHPVNS
ncbi:hypothetical protein [Nostoc sp.]|uniref:hypothetical protein n=1 Tax=Nostoc sp. TaxID=1180 RepID=UPI002FF8C920